MNSKDLSIFLLISLLFSFLFFSFSSVSAQSSAPPPPNYNCTFLGYDLSDFSIIDLNYTDTVNNWRYYFRLCNEVQNSVCRADDSSNSSMICQTGLTGGDAYSLAQYTVSRMIWSTIPNGISMSLDTGESEYCSAGLTRRVRLDFLCSSATRAPGFISNLDEPSSCFYIFTITTPQVCPVDCTFQNIDFSPMRSNQMAIPQTNSGHSVVFRMCGRITDLQCRMDADGSANQAMICQKQNPPGTNALDIADFNRNAMIWTRPSTTTLQFQQFNGENCQNGTSFYPRSVTVLFTCDLTAGAAGKITRFDEPSTCVYRLMVNTSLVCGTSIPVTQPCKFLGFDFTSLSTVDLSAHSSPNASPSTAWFRMCGVVQNSFCANDLTARTSMICQTDDDGNDAVALAEYNSGRDLVWSTISAADRIFELSIANGELCGGSYRKVTVIFQCDRAPVYTGPVPAYLSRFDEPDTCDYHLTVNTSIVCSDVISTCSFAGFDFTALAQKDLSVTMANSGWTYYFRPCGRVLAEACQYDLDGSASYSMFCQTSTGRGTYNLGGFDPSSFNSTAIPFGYQIVQRNGESTGACPGFRQSIYRFICDLYAVSASDNHMISVQEPSTCNYVATILTPAVCPAWAWPTWIRPPGYCSYTVPGDRTYDLSPLSQADLTYIYTFNSTNVWNIYMRFCSVVANPNCHYDDTTVNSMICQQRSINPVPDNYAIAYPTFNPDAYTWTKTANGINAVLQNGEVGCGGVMRTADITFNCNPTAPTGGRIVGYSEAPGSCRYQITLETPIVCSSDSSDTSSSSSSASTIIIVVVVLILVLASAGAGYYFYRRQSSGNGGGGGGGRSASNGFGLFSDEGETRTRSFLGGGGGKGRSDNMEMNDYVPPRSGRNL